MVPDILCIETKREVEMKERVLVLIQGIVIGMFGVLCIFQLGFNGIGIFFSVVGMWIGLVAIFGTSSNSADE